MYAEYFCSRRRAPYAYSLLLVIICSTSFQAYSGLWINGWNQRLFDDMSASFAGENETATDEGGKSTTISAEDLDLREENFRRLFHEWIMYKIPFWLSFPLQGLVMRLLAFEWREALTASYLYRWLVLSKKRDVSIESASQRVQEDCSKFATAVVTFGLTFMTEFVKVATFTPLLWEKTLVLEGYPSYTLVLIAYAGNIIGVGVSMLVGSRLVGLEYENQRAEAAFRKELVYAEDATPGRGELPVTHALFRALKRNFYTLFRHFVYIEGWQVLFDQLASMFPFVFLAHSVYRGKLTLGEYTSTVSAFSTVNGGLSTLIHKWIDFVELLSVIRRLRELEASLPPLSPTDGDPRRHIRHLDKGASQPLETSPLVGARPGAKTSGVFV